jgi:hypothetical protein
MYVQVADLTAAVSEVVSLADLPGIKSKLSALEHEAGSSDIWDAADQAKALMSEISSLQAEQEQLQRWVGCAIHPTNNKCVW